jgi:hypothetical protein
MADRAGPITILLSGVKRLRIISKFVENQRAGLFIVSCYFMGPEENPA